MKIFLICALYEKMRHNIFLFVTLDIGLADYQMWLDKDGSCNNFFSVDVLPPRSGFGFLLRMVSCVRNSVE